MLHQIGVGALGPVFRTYEPQRDRLVAVKVFRLDITPEQARALADELSRSADAGLFHPSIVEPIAAGVEGTVAFHAEEYVAAESLDVAMRHYAPAPVAAALPFITQLAGAIDFARAVGVGHGALHPRDIFMTPDDARASGFGVVEALERVGLRAPVRRPYSPPERIAGSPWSTEADVFSLAAIAYELLTGRRPAGPGLQIGPMPPESERLQRVLARAMAEDPQARYRTALAFAAALEAAARGETDTAATEHSAAAPGISPAAAAPLAAAAALSPSAARGGEAGDDDPLGRAGGIEDQDDDVAAERDEDDAHHRLLLQEAEERDGGDRLPEREADAPLAEDIEAEAEADRYAGDDFLLDAAAVASAADLDTIDLRPNAPPVDRRALDDDEVMVDEPPSPLFRPEDLRNESSGRATEPPRAASLPAAAPPLREPVHASFGRTSSGLGHYAPASVDEPPPRRSRLPLAIVLLAGLVGGLAAGYALWGGGTRPGQEWTEGTVGTADPAASRAEDPAGPAASAGTAGSGSAPPASDPVRRPADPPEPDPVAPSGTLVVRSQPTGAGVTVNGQWKGRTPLTLERLPFARYEVRVVQPGYGSGTEVVTLSGTTPSRSLSLRLRREERAEAPAEPRRPARGSERERPVAAAAASSYTGSIYVDSRPRGARVSIDGKSVGVTPLSVPDIRIGSHVVRLELPDHRIWSTSTRVSAGETSRVTGSLERIQ